jgi:peptide/histidine transporter 3/4
VCWYILIVELCERLSFYTITGSQAFFLEHIGFSLSSAGAINATMWTLCTVLAVLASWMADVGLGRYLTILAAGMVYALGATVAAFAALPGRENAGWYFCGVMGLLPLATAGIKANISNFGADQYDENDPAQKAAQERFFSIFYCSINVGAAVAYGFFTTFASNGGLGVPREWGYASAYGVMGLCMLLAVCIYRAGRRSYKVHPLLHKSALASLLGSLCDCAVRRCSLRAASVMLGLGLLCTSIAASAMRSLLPQTGDTMMFASFISALLGTLMVVVPCLNPSWVESEDKRDSELADVKEFLGLMPALFTGSLSFNALYNCMQFWYAQQACQMDLRFPIFGSGYQLSGSFFNIADCLAIVIVTPLAVIFANPWMDSMSKGQFNHKAKFTLGMLIAATSVCCAARLEIQRRAMPVLPQHSNCAPPGIGMSAIPGAWMLMPFFLMGVAEIYTQPTLLHMAYSKSPPSMRSLAMAASFFIAAVSSALFALLISALKPYMPNDLNDGHLEYGYYINISLGAFFLVLFLSVSNSTHDHTP